MKISVVEKMVFAIIAFIATLIAIRIYCSYDLCYLFLLGNIFLAYIPFKFSLLVSKEKQIGLRSVIFFSIWLLFFPNSLYLVTDLIHLEQRGNIPMVYDAVLLYTSASAGLIMAFISLYKIESFLKDKLAPAVVKLVIFFCLFLGSFGVYLGRFLRWNSWTIVTHPARISIGIAERVLLPFDYLHVWACTFLFTSLFTGLYFLLKNLPGYLDKERTN